MFRLPYQNLNERVFETILLLGHKKWDNNQQLVNDVQYFR